MERKLLVRQTLTLLFGTYGMMKVTNSLVSPPNHRAGLESKKWKMVMVRPLQHPVVADESGKATVRPRPEVESLVPEDERRHKPRLQILRTLHHHYHWILFAYLLCRFYLSFAIYF